MKIEHFRSAFVILLATITVTISFQNCRDMGDSYTYDDVNGIQVRADVSSFFLTNRTGETIYYMVVERQTSYVIDWIPGCDPSRSVQSGRTIEVPYSQVTGYKKECEIVLFWWRCSGTMPRWPGGGGSIVFQTP